MSKHTYQSVMFKVGKGARVVLFLAWAAALAALRSTPWFWVLFGLSFVQFAVDWSVAHHLRTVRGWIADRLVATGAAQPMDPIATAIAINQGRITSYRVFLNGSWSNHKSIDRAMACQVCRRDNEIEIALFVDECRDEQVVPASHVLFPPFVLLREEGAHIEFQADAAFISGPIIPGTDFDDDDN